MTTSRKKLSNPLTLILALIAGFGLILMCLSLGIGVVLSEVTGTVIAGLFVVGLILLVFGIGGWFVAVQPHRHFDDINVPKDIAHHDEPHGEHDIVVAEETHIVEPDVPSHS
ncbi:MAG: hypothetical protein DIU68_003550 [Chloroflexota bacterium]|nr:MAG: hypothetical protein DIU68_03495 [Chloroflexota bacterium]